MENLTVPLTVVDNVERSRFELVRDGDVVGFADYRAGGPEGSPVVFPHTVIDRDKRGQGLGAILVRGALDQIRGRGQTIDPQCWYVAEFVETHADYADLVAS